MFTKAAPLCILLIRLVTVLSRDPPNPLSTFTTTTVSQTDEPTKIKFFDEPIPHIILQNPNINYGNSFIVGFNLNGATPSDRDYVAILPDEPDVDPLDESREVLQMYVYTDQNRDSGAYYDDGIVRFGVTDPATDYGKLWPLSVGRYAVCLIHYADDYVGYELLGSCQKLSVELHGRRKDTARHARLRPSKAEYAYGERIEAFFLTPVKIPNSWVGIFRYEGLVPTTQPLDNYGEFLWVFTGCDNVEGDQAESNDCAVTSRRGTVSFQGNNTGRADLEWPLPPGDYFMAIVFSNNKPYATYKPAKEFFTIVA